MQHGSITLSCSNNFCLCNLLYSCTIKVASKIHSRYKILSVSDIASMFNYVARPYTTTCTYLHICNTHQSFDMTTNYRQCSRTLYTLWHCLVSVYYCTRLYARLILFKNLNLLRFRLESFSKDMNKKNRFLDWRNKLDKEMSCQIVRLKNSMPCF